MAKAKAETGRKITLGRALVVEDDAILAMTIEQALLDGGAKSVTLCSGIAEAMASLEASRPEVVVLDVHLSDRDDGWALAELLTQLGPRPPRIIFSTGSPEAIPEAIAALGIVMAKPYEPEDLVAAIHSQKRSSSLFGKLREAFAPAA